MNIKTKYEIGQRVWIVYETNTKYGLSGKVSIYDVEIGSIFISKNEITYCCKDNNYTELKEEDVILYEDKEKLLSKIEDLMQEIDKRENH